MGVVEGFASFASHLASIIQQTTSRIVSQRTVAATHAVHNALKSIARACCSLSPRCFVSLSHCFSFVAVKLEERDAIMEIDFHVRVTEYLDALSHLKDLKGEKYNNKVMNQPPLSLDVASVRRGWVGGIERGPPSYSRPCKQLSGFFFSTNPVCPISTLHLIIFSVYVCMCV